nr:hypothetical protein [Tanacetum cinerariifolium]
DAATWVLGHSNMGWSGEVDGSVQVKENQEKDKIGSKPDKNGKRVEAGKSLKQLQLKEEEKPKKIKKEWPKTQTRIKSYSTVHCALLLFSRRS